MEDSIRYALESFKEIKKDPSFAAFENKNRILREIFAKYIKIATATLAKTKFKNE